MRYSVIWIWYTILRFNYAQHTGGQLTKHEALGLHGFRLIFRNGAPQPLDEQAIFGLPAVTMITPESGTMGAFIAPPIYRFLSLLLTTHKCQEQVAIGV